MLRYLCLLVGFSIIGGKEEYAGKCKFKNSTRKRVIQNTESSTCEGRHEEK